MTDRALLTDARELIVAMVDWNKAMLKIVGHIPDTGFQSAEGLLSRIDDHLADHSPDAGNMVARELVEDIRSGGFAFNANNPKDRGPNGDDYHFTLTDSEAAALIEQYGCRVPREMLEKIEKQAFKYGREAFLSYESIDHIAAKYGVKIEEATHD